MPPPSARGFAGFRLFAQVRSDTNGVNGSSVSLGLKLMEASVSPPCHVLGFIFSKGLEPVIAFSILSHLLKKKKKYGLNVGKSRGIQSSLLNYLFFHIYIFK